MDYSACSGIFFEFSGFLLSKSFFIVIFFGIFFCPNEQDNHNLGLILLTMVEMVRHCCNI